MDTLHDLLQRSEMGHKITMLSYHYGKNNDKI